MSEEKTVNYNVVPVTMTKYGSVEGALKDKESVIMDLYRGQSRLQDHMLSQSIVFRLKVRFVGNLAKYVPVDAAVAKELIETIDIHYELIEYFFSKRLTKEALRRVLHPLIDIYFSKKIGERVGCIKFGHTEFAEFVSFMRYLCYEPLLNWDVL